jgi:hypothetical protein
MNRHCAKRLGKGESTQNVIPFTETLRVTNPVRQGRASSREASVAWVGSDPWTVSDPGYISGWGQIRVTVYATDTSPDILELGRLHAKMDRAALGANGWHDLAKIAACEFLLEYEDDEDEDDTSSYHRQKKKSWRSRWPDDFRDEVSARLLELNR